MTDSPRLQNLKTKLARAEERINRAETNEDYLVDLWIIQRTGEEIRELCPQAPDGLSGFQN
jgi:hypothetical protein